LAGRTADQHVKLTRSETSGLKEIFGGILLDWTRQEARFAMCCRERLFRSVEEIVCRQYVIASLPKTFAQTARTAKQIDDRALHHARRLPSFVSNLVSHGSRYVHELEQVLNI
jgi:hypothetical protein